MISTISSESDTHDLDLFRCVLDTLEDQLCILTSEATIVFVNASWIRFASENASQPDLCATSWLGTNYLDACQPADDFAMESAIGIRKVLTREIERFQFEYPCHSPTEQRWFLMRIRSITGFHSSLFLVSHLNITHRKLIEERVKALSLHDPLTGLSNRRHFDMALHQEYLRAHREQSDFCLAMLDLDHFKDLNDTQGHQRGDQFLLDVSAILKSACRRPADLAARYGGDEFVLILSNTTRSTATDMMNKCRHEIELLNLKYQSTPPITASVGIAGSEDLKEVSGEVLFRAADLALYQAKKRGRNACVCCVAWGDNGSQRFYPEALPA